MQNHIYIIAEAGVNHNGDINIAKKLIDVAQMAGADAVKFQTFKAEYLVAKTALKAEYQKKTTNLNESQYEMIKKLELSLNDHKILKDYCYEKKIEFLSTPFDLNSIDLLKSIGVNRWKIPSGELTNLPYLRKVASMAGEIILSTGMATLGEIEDALSVLYNNGVQRENICILHCTTEYPAPIHEVNLSAMLTIAEAFKVKVGYSDHTAGIEIPIAAAALGAKIIEKHFTLDKNLPGPDHMASLEPDELSCMIRSIRNIESAMGNGVKIPSESESRNKLIARKSIVALICIKKGEPFTENNITVKRPGNGISPMLWDEIIGTIAQKDYSEDELI